MNGATTDRRARMMRAWWPALRRWWVRVPAIVRQCGMAAGIALIAYLACFPIARPVTFDMGRFPDRLVISGFNIGGGGHKKHHGEG